MRIPIKTTERKFFRQLIGLLANFPPIKGLRPRELGVLAELLYENYRLRDIKPELRSVVIFSTENRKNICSNLGISEDTLNNNLSILRRRGLISKDNKLEKYLDILPNGSFTFAVTFDIKNDDN